MGSLTECSLNSPLNVLWLCSISVLYLIPFLQTGFGQTGFAGHLLMPEQLWFNFLPSHLSAGTAQVPHTWSQCMCWTRMRSPEQGGTACSLFQIWARAMIYSVSALYNRLFSYPHKCFKEAKLVVFRSNTVRWMLLCKNFDSGAIISASPLAASGCLFVWNCCRLVIFSKSSSLSTNKSMHIPCVFMFPYCAVQGFYFLGEKALTL